MTRKTRILCALFYAILHEELEFLQIVESLEVLGPIPCQYQGMIKVWGHVKLYADI